VRREGRRRGERGTRGDKLEDNVEMLIGDDRVNVLDNVLVVQLLHQVDFILFTKMGVLKSVTGHGGEEGQKEYHKGVEF